jgi:hypothetical protein
MAAIQQYAGNFGIDFNTAVNVLSLQCPVETSGEDDFSRAVITLQFMNKTAVTDSKEYARLMA